MKMFGLHAFAREVAVALAVFSLVSGCRKKTNSEPDQSALLALTGLAASRPFAVATVTISTLEGTLDRLGAFAKDLGLPFDVNDARTWATSQIPKGAAVAATLDLRKPMGMGMVASPTPKADGLMAVAFTLKDGSPKGFSDFLAVVGTVKSRDKDAVQIVPAGDAGTPKRMWLLTRKAVTGDAVVLAAESREALVAAGLLAMDARKTAADDVQITIWPEGIARTQGTDLATAVAKAKTDFRSAFKKDGPATPAVMALGYRTIDALLDGFTQLSDVRFGVSLDKTRGLSLKTVGAAKPGTDLAKLFGPGKPYRLEPQLLSGASPAAVGALGSARFTKPLVPLLRGVIETLVQGRPGRDKGLAAFDTVTKSLAGPWSAALRMEEGTKLGFAYDIVYELERATKAQTLLAAIQELIQGEGMGELMKSASLGLVKSKVTSKMEGDTLVARLVLDLTKVPEKAKQGLDQIPGFDGSALETRAAVAGDKLFVVVGTRSTERLAALRDKPIGDTAPDPVLASALEETKDDESLSYIDLGAILRPALTLLGGMKGVAGDNPSIGMATMLAPLLAKTNLAMYSSYRGSSDGLSLSWRIPAATFKSVASLFRAVTGGGPPGK